ncbi:MAG: phage terminase large subunit [Cohaesibacteraceae bacterium]|nr:phage terminase large subunit [Cohaesibacteraceae bacterium]MBL4875763.1 phage terminase large subunit [Cohaesibacteraceae bacterium]
MIIVKDPLKEDFRVFLSFIWEQINLPKPTKVQIDLAIFLQHGPNKICIQAFRGVGKSFVTSAYVLWELYRDPQNKIMVVSASKNRADNFTTFALNLINTVPELVHLKPKASQRQSRLEFDVGPALPDQTPSVFSKGIDSQLTGGRADIIISDDVEVPNNSMTVERRDALIERTKEYSAILKPLENSRIIYLGTPQTEDSIYNKLPETFTNRIWPAYVPTSEEVEAYGSSLAPLIRTMYDKGLYGVPTDPERFDEEELQDRRAEYGAAGFSLQFMLNTKLSDEERYPLKLKDLIVMPVPPLRAPIEVHWLPNPDRQLKDLPNHGMAGDKLFSVASHGNEFDEYQLRVMAIDPSGRGKDETGYAVGFQLAGNVWVPEAGGLTGGYEPETLQVLAKIAKKHKVHCIVIESNFGDGMFAKLFEPFLNREHPCTIEEVRHHTMKEMRIIDTMEPVVSGHRLIVDPDVLSKDDQSIQKYEPSIRNSRSLFYQMTHICREKGALRFDDRIDVMAILIAHFTELMNQDSKRAAEDEYMRLMDEEFLKFIDSAGGTGGSRGNNTWVDT